MRERGGGKPSQGSRMPSRQQRSEGLKPHSREVGREGTGEQRQQTHTRRDKNICSIASPAVPGSHTHTLFIGPVETPYIPGDRNELCARADFLAQKWVANESLPLGCASPLPWHKRICFRVSGLLDAAQSTKVCLVLSTIDLA